nr:tetratricopeptide repeat protein [Zavarzinella formosa]
MTGGEPKADPYADALALEETEPAKAEAFYQTMLGEDENNGRARVGLARMQAAAGKDAEALEMLAPLGDTGEHGADVVKIRRMIEMRANAATAGDETDLRKKIAAAPENPALRLELGNLLATRGDYQPAMDELLVAAELDRELGRGAVRELMVKIFEIIGVRSDLADEYRDKLRGLLY